MSQLRVVAYRESSSRTAMLKLKSDDGTTAKKEGKPSVVGWEKNDKAKLGPRLADLAPLMDPTKFVYDCAGTYRGWGN
jgi:ubiquitin-like modifier-activating enzyme ATG7